MTITLSALRQNIYRIIDELIETGEPIIISRKGTKVIISREDNRKPMDRLIDRSSQLDQSHDEMDLGITEGDWQKEWEEEWKELGFL